MTGESEAEKIGRLAHLTVWVMACLSVALVLTGGIIIWAEIRTDEVYVPLHYTNPQTVTSRVNALSGAPATTLGDTVNVTGEKCADETVNILVVTTWKPVEPRGLSIITDPEHPAVREDGCVTSRFENEIPDEVAAIVRLQHARGQPAPLWQITGVETPINDNGREGSPEVWTTEPFAIVAP